MLATLHVLLSEGLADRPFIDRYSVGFEPLEEHVFGKDGSPAKTPRWAEGICGTPETDIVGFAREYGTAKPALLFPGYSIQRVSAGEDPYRLTVALQVATGNVGVPGGSSGSMNNKLPTPAVGTLPVPDNPCGAAVPIVRWPDLILEGRAGGYPSDIRAVYAAGCNFLNQGADVRKNIRAFEALDFAVCHELFMTPTARWCDVVLPAAHALEKSDIGIPWAGNFLAYKTRAAAPAGLARTDYDILSDLADRLGFGGEFTEGRDEAAWLDLFLEQSEVPDPQAFRREGVYFGADQERVGLADFIADPVGRPLSTPSGKIEIAGERYTADTGFPAAPGWREQPRDERHPLSLITPKARFRTHSQGSGIPEIARRAAHALSLNPEDAAERGIADGEEARVYNDRGAVRVAVRLDGDLMRGVACLPEGVWADLDENGEDRGGSANMLTATDGSLPSIANVMHGIGVQVERISPRQAPER
jgi:anaerobic dimethyl sulfoxide reductase subunit A